MSIFATYPRITPFLWFNDNAEQAVDFYLSIFKDARKFDPVHHNGKVLTLGFELEGLHFTALNGGPLFQFNESVSFVVRCDTQADIDHYWDKLTEGGKPGQCCWLKDKFGLSWQIIPTRLPELIQSPKAMQAMMQMTKPDIATLEQAAQS